MYCCRPARSVQERAACGKQRSEAVDCSPHMVVDMPNVSGVIGTFATSSKERMRAFWGRGGGGCVP